MPSSRCFLAAYAVSRGDASRALDDTRATPYVIGTPAAIVAGLAAPVALTGPQPCDLCLQLFLAVVVLAGYALPALIAALLPCVRAALAGSRRTHMTASRVRGIGFPRRDH